jgi:hypothetical protein
MVADGEQRRSASRYGLGLEEAEPLLIVDVDKSAEIDAPMPQ